MVGVFGLWYVARREADEKLQDAECGTHEPRRGHSRIASMPHDRVAK